MFLGWLLFFAMGVAVVLVLNGLIFGGLALARHLRRRPKGVVASAAAGGAIVLALVAGADGPSPALVREAELQAEHLRAEGLEVRTVVVDPEEARRLQALGAEAAESELPAGELLVMLQDPPAAPAAPASTRADGPPPATTPSPTRVAGLVEALGGDLPAAAAAPAPARDEGPVTSPQPAPIHVARLVDAPLGED